MGDAKKKWSLIMGKSSMKSPVSDKTNASKSSTGKKSKKKPNGASKLSQIDNKLNMLTKEIELNLERNTEMASKKMAKMEKLQKKKKKKILESEGTEFDHFCRASRKYLISNVYLEQIEKCNNSNVKQQRALYKQQNKENKEKYFEQVTVRDRLREIKERHIAQFEQIIARQEEQQQKKQKHKPKPSNEAKKREKQNEKTTKYVPQKVASQQAIEKKASSKPKKLTFAEKMRAKRGLLSAGSTSSSSSFGDQHRFSRSASFNGSGSGSSPSSFGGGRGRFGTQMNGNNDNHNNGNKQQNNNNIRPK